MTFHLRLLIGLLSVPVILAIGSCTKQGDPSPTSRNVPAPPNQSALPLFEEIAERAGLKFHHCAGATGEYYFPEIMGAGVALLDYDDDGDLDVFCVQSGFLDKSKGREDSIFPLPSDWKPGCRLFRNRWAETGRLEFVDVTAASGITYEGYGMGAAVGDYDNDGKADLYVTGFRQNALYRNQGNGAFRDVTAQAGVQDGRWSVSAAFVDYDADGLLDLAVVNYVDFAVAKNRICYSAAGERDYCAPSTYRGTASRLFRNLGGGRFKDVSAESGIGSAIGPGLGVACADVNGDRRIDLFIANDAAPNHLWLNQGGGRFIESALASGVAMNADGQPRGNMGIAMGDFANDGTEAICVTHIIQEGVSFYRADSSGAYRDAAAETGLLAATTEFTGFGTDWLDYDNDGFLDLFIANGAVKRGDGHSDSNPFAQTNQLFRNEGGARLVDISKHAGTAFARAEVGRGAALGDMDNDGGIDVVVSNNNGPVRLLRNIAPSRGNWFSVRLVGVKANRMGLGARVGVTLPGGITIWRRCHTDGSYAGASDSRVHFGLAKAKRVQSVTVQWPGGLEEKWPGVDANRVATLRQGSGKPLTP